MITCGLQVCSGPPSARALPCCVGLGDCERGEFKAPRELSSARLTVCGLTMNADAAKLSEPRKLGFAPGGDALGGDCVHAGGVARLV